MLYPKLSLEELISEKPVRILWGFFPPILVWGYLLVIKEMFEVLAAEGPSAVALTFDWQDMIWLPVWPLHAYREVRNENERRALLIEQNRQV